MSESRARRRPVGSAAVWVATLVLAAAGCSDAMPHTDPPHMHVTTEAEVAAGLLKDVGSGTCPTQAPQLPASNASGLLEQTEPLVADRLLLCGYPPVQDVERTPGVPSPDVAVVSGSADVARMRDALNSLPGPQGAGGAVGCPSDDGSAVLAVFGNGSQVVPVLIGLTGCRTVSNGIRDAGATQALITRTLLLMPRSFCVTLSPADGCPATS